MDGPVFPRPGQLSAQKEFKPSRGLQCSELGSSEQNLTAVLLWHPIVCVCVCVCTRVCVFVWVCARVHSTLEQRPSHGDPATGSHQGTILRAPPLLPWPAVAVRV